MAQANDLSRSPVPLCQDSALIAVIEMSQSSWLVAGIVPGVGRRPLKKLVPDAGSLLGLLQHWRDEATKAGRTITRVAICVRSRPRRLLAGALVAGAGHRSLRVARTSTGEDGSARHRAAQTRLAQRYWARTQGPGGSVRKTLIVALARKLLVALWRFVTTGELPAGVVLRAA
jgi:hypothetical protein